MFDHQITIGVCKPMIIIEPINLLYSGFACFGMISFAVVMGYIGMWLHSKTDKTPEESQNAYVRNPDKWI